MSKELKKCLFRRRGSDNLLPRNGNERKTHKGSRNEILGKCNEMLKRIQCESFFPGMNVDFGTKDSSVVLNGLFRREGICGILEAKNYRYVDYVYPSIALFIDRVCGEQRSVTTGISVIYI